MSPIMRATSASVLRRVGHLQQRALATEEVEHRRGRQLIGEPLRRLVEAIRLHVGVRDEGGEHLRRRAAPLALRRLRSRRDRQLDRERREVERATGEVGSSYHRGSGGWHHCSSALRERRERRGRWPHADAAAECGGHMQRPCGPKLRARGRRTRREGLSSQRRVGHSRRPRRPWNQHERSRSAERTTRHEGCWPREPRRREGRGDVRARRARCSKMFTTMSCGHWCVQSASWERYRRSRRDSAGRSVSSDARKRAGSMLVDR